MNKDAVQSPIEYTDSTITLLLNASFEPLKIVSWMRAFGLVFQEKVEILAEYDLKIATVQRRFNIPAVLKLRRYVPLRRLGSLFRFSRNNIYLRDRFSCQYCGMELHSNKLTLDHIIPVAKGGRKTWENIVAACLSCNQRKGKLSLEDAGMRLLRAPCVPQYLPLLPKKWGGNETPPLWEPYLNVRR